MTVKLRPFILKWARVSSHVSISSASKLLDDVIYGRGLSIIIHRYPWQSFRLTNLRNREYSTSFVRHIHLCRCCSDINFLDCDVKIVLTSEIIASQAGMTAMRGSSQNGVITNGRVYYWRFNWKLGDSDSEIIVWQLEVRYLCCGDWEIYWVNVKVTTPNLSLKLLNLIQ